MARKRPEDEFPFNEIVRVSLSEISPESGINVRRTGIEENVELVKSSIQAHGYWPDAPVALRPHPDPQSAYAYESVTGQCRMKASFALNLKEIPAIIVDLDDDAALKRSFMENSKRGALSFPDCTYWVERKYNELMTQGMTSQEAFEQTAAFWDLTVPKAEQYFTLHSLPSELKEMVERKELPQNAALAIVESCRNQFDIEQGEEAMKERAEWFCAQDREQRKLARKAMRASGHNASLEDVSRKFEELTSRDQSTIPVTLPAESKEKLIQYGQDRGIYEPAAIISNIVAQTLRD